MFLCLPMTSLEYVCVFRDGYVKGDGLIAFFVLKLAADFIVKVCLWVLPPLP